jgi:hypothetical protein
MVYYRPYKIDVNNTSSIIHQKIQPCEALLRRNNTSGEHDIMAEWKLMCFVALFVLAATVRTAEFPALTPPLLAEDFASIPGNPGHLIRVCAPDSLRTDCDSISLSATLQGASDRDVIVLSSGEYHEAGVLSASNVTLRGEPGAHIKDSTVEGKASLVIKGNDTIVSGIECSGAKVSDSNGACIRLEGRNLLVTGVYFHHNENGILTGHDGNSDVIVENSEFAYNGDGSGKSHNLYIGQVRSFTLRGCLSHHALNGHLVKSRAQTNTISYNRLIDGPDGTSSYVIDVPNAGTSYIIGNVIQQGPQTSNSTVIAYGGEGIKNQERDLYVINNTIINERQAGGVVVRNWSNHPARLVNNIIIGNINLLEGPGQLDSNEVSPQYNFHELVKYSLSNPRAVWNDPSQLLTLYNGIDFKFADPQLYDFRLSVSSPAIDAGIDPGIANGVSLRPIMEYSHPLKLIPRPVNGPLDVGAFEYVKP